MLGEAIGHGGSEALSRAVVGVNLQVAKHAKRPQVVNARHMVEMDVREQNGVEAPERQRQYLLAEIGTTVNEQARGGRLKQG